MRALLIISTIILLGILLIASFIFPQSYLLLFASNEPSMNALRAVAIIALIALLATKPPRSVLFRVFLIGLSSVIVVSSMLLLYSYEFQIIDATIAIIISIVCAIEGLEHNTAQAKRTSHRRGNASVYWVRRLGTFKL